MTKAHMLFGKNTIQSASVYTKYIATILASEMKAIIYDGA